jgi:hypothetical protein
LISAFVLFSVVRRVVNFTRGQGAVSQLPTLKSAEQLLADRVNAIEQRLQE